MTHIRIYAMLALAARIAQSGGTPALTCTANPNECAYAVRQEMEKWAGTCQSLIDGDAPFDELMNRACPPCTSGDYHLLDANLDLQILQRMKSYLHDGWARHRHNGSAACDRCNGNDDKECQVYCGGRNDDARDIAYNNATSFDVYGAALQACVNVTGDQPSCLRSQHSCQPWSPACGEVAYRNCHRRASLMALRFTMQPPCMPHVYMHRFCAFNDAPDASFDVLDRMIEVAGEVIRDMAVTEPQLIF